MNDDCVTASKGKVEKAVFRPAKLRAKLPNIARNLADIAAGQCTAPLFQQINVGKTFCLCFFRERVQELNNGAFAALRLIVTDFPCQRRIITCLLSFCQHDLSLPGRIVGTADETQPIF